MTKKTPEKCNDACIKLFQFIKLLYEGDVELKTVLDLLSDGKYDGTSNTHVTLNKYLNALKIFGIKVKKVHGKYRMFTPLYKMKFDLDDYKSINLLKGAYNVLPEGKNKSHFQEFLRKLEMRYDQSVHSLNQIADNTQNLHLSFYNSEMVEQLNQCERYCLDNQKLELIYTDDKGEDINILCSPLEAVYQKRKIYLKALGNNGSRIYEIPLENIKSVKQLPSSSSAQSIPTTVVFRIKNRLAQNYRIRDWERLEKIESNGSRIIVNKNEDFNQLLKRIMRYGKECEIISPKFLKEEMVELINKTLSNYQ